MPPSAASLVALPTTNLLRAASAHAAGWGRTVDAPGDRSVADSALSGAAQRGAEMLVADQKLDPPHVIRGRGGSAAVAQR